MAKTVIRRCSITRQAKNDMDFTARTDALKAKDQAMFIADCLHNRNTVEFLELGERVNCSTVGRCRAASVRSQAWLNNYKLDIMELA